MAASFPTERFLEVVWAWLVFVLVDVVKSESTGVATSV